MLTGFQGTVSSLRRMGAGDVWCGEESGRISTMSSAAGFSGLSKIGAHTRFVSGMTTVRCLESRTTWSHSLGDESIKVWRQTVTQGTSGGVLEGLVEDLAMRLQAMERALQGHKTAALEHEQRVAQLKAQVRELTEALEERSFALTATKTQLTEKEEEMEQLVESTATNTSVAGLLRATIQQREYVSRVCFYFVVLV